MLVPDRKSHSNRLSYEVINFQSLHTANGIRLLQPM